MAIHPENQYPGKIAPSTSSYPYGEARNITTPGDGTGTPWEQALINDLFGFQQALLTESGLTPSGSPDTATASQYLAAIKTLTRTRVDFTTRIQTNTLPDVRIYQSDFYDQNKVPDSGATWVFTGNTVGGSAGTLDAVNGLVYDANGKEYALTDHAISITAVGANENGVSSVENLALIESVKASAFKFYVPANVSIPIGSDPLADVYHLTGDGVLRWPTRGFSIRAMNATNEDKTLSHYGAKCRDGGEVIFGFIGDSTVQGVNTTGQSTPPSTGIAPNIVPTTPVGDLNAYGPNSWPVKFQIFARFLFSNNNIKVANGAFGGTALSNGWARQYFDDIFLNNTSVTFQNVQTMFICFNRNDAGFNPTGTANTLDDYTAEMGYLVKKLRGYGITPVICQADPAFLSTGEVLEQAELENAARSVAEKLNVQYAPIGGELEKFYANSTLAAWGQDMTDKVHAGDKGHRAKAGALLRRVAATEIYEYDGESDGINISFADEKCRGKSDEIQTDSVVTQSTLHFGIRHRIAKAKFGGNEILAEAWVWVDDPQALLYHMLSSNEYLDTTTAVQMPKITVENVAVNFDAPSTKTVYTSDVGRPTFGVRVEEKPALVTRLRYGLNRIRFYTPDSGAINDTYFNTGWLSVVTSGQNPAMLEGKTFDALGKAGRTNSRLISALKPDLIIPVVGAVNVHATLPAYSLRAGPCIGQTADTVVDFEATLYDHTGFTFGTGITQGAAPQGYAVHIEGATANISLVSVATATGIATVTTLKTAAIALVDYDGVRNAYRLRVVPSDGVAIGVKIELYKYTAGVPSLVVSFDSEVDDPSKRAISACGWLFGGFWDYNAGSAGETLSIHGGTIYSKVT